MQMATGSSCEPEEGSPSFFKVIRNPSAPHLSLPNAFVRRYLEKIPKHPTLVAATGEHSWTLEFVKIGEDYCFAHGWEKLVKDVQLCSRDIAVFWLIDPLTFHVLFLGANGCEKDLPFGKTNDDDNVKDDGRTVGDCRDDDEVMPVENLCFKKVISGKTYRYHMLLPMKFVKAAGLEHKKSIKLKDHEGKEWTMGIIAQRYGSTKYVLSEGWAMLRKYHKLSDGDVCMFTYNKKQGVLNLRVFRSRRPIKQETPMDEVNGNRGRPPCYSGGNVKIEDDWSPNKKPCGDGGDVVKVKIEYESGPEMEAAKTKRGTPPRLEKPSRDDGMVAKTQPGTERVFRSKHVIYF